MEDAGTKFSFISKLYLLFYFISHLESDVDDWS